MHRKCFTIFLSVLIAFAMMPYAALAADGETVIYNLWVGDTRVTSDTMNGDGWSFEADSTGGTLTLTDATITETHSFGLADQRAGIYANNIDFELTIRLVGENTISAGNEGKAYGIWLDDDLTITGDGSLDIDAGQHGINAGAITLDNTDVRITGDSTCIYANGANNIVINGGKVELTSDGTGAFCGTLITSNNAELSVNTRQYGLHTDRIEIRDSVLTLDTVEDPAFYAQTGDVIIDNSEVSAKTSGDDAIRCYSDDCNLYIIGSKVIAEAGGYAITANSISISDGSGSIKTYVEAKTSSSKTPAIFAETEDGITLGEGLDIKTPEGGSVGSCVSYGTNGTSVNDQNDNMALHVIIQHHVLELTKGVKPTCTEQGASEYYTCSICGKYFSDENGSNEISENSWILPPTGHDWGEWKNLDDKQHERACTYDSTHTEQAEHIWDAGKVTKEATENEAGIRTFTCTVCGAARTEAIPKLKPEPKPEPAAKVSGTLLAKITAKGKSSLVLTWTKVKGAEGYDVFFGKCTRKDSKGNCRKIKSIKGNNTFKMTKKGLKKGRAYKAYVKAYVMKNGKKTYVGTSPMVHAYTSGGTRNYTNSRSVTVKKKKVSLKAGKTYKIKANVTKLRKGRKLMPSGHAPKLRYVSSNKKTATVSKSGKITAKSKGSCKVYVIAVNGARKAVTVTVN